MPIVCWMGVCIAVALLVPGPRIRPTADPVRIEVAAPLPAALASGPLTQDQGERWLRLALVDPDSGRAGPAILGRYERRAGELIFAPRFSLVRGQRYRATLERNGGRSVSVEYRVPPRPTAPAAVVERIYPSAGTLPANQLKFYLHFSRPMREGKEIFDRIQLLDQDGKVIPDAWRQTELWSTDARRLTLWIHPGRIKRGVSLREEFGPVLRPDRQYTLVIRGDLRDAEGRPLGKPYTKKFRTGAEDHTRLRVEDWQLRAPAAATTRSLVLDFPRPLDRALLERMLTVTDARGKAVAGRIEVGSDERSWQFHPARPWQAADYTVTVDGQLEDLAGNTPLRVFDTDLSQPAPAKPRLTLRFRPD